MNKVIEKITKKVENVNFNITSKKFHIENDKLLFDDLQLYLEFFHAMGHAKIPLKELNKLPKIKFGWRSKYRADLGGDIAQYMICWEDEWEQTKSKINNKPLNQYE